MPVSLLYLYSWTFGDKEGKEERKKSLLCSRKKGQSSSLHAGSLKRKEGVRKQGSKEAEDTY
jgi:hypothetical protein